MTYSISDPIGNNDKWQTGYDDAGVYEITVKAEGKGFSGSKEVKVTVENKDRPPVFIDLRDVTTKEDEETSIELNAQDPDGDKIIFSAENMPNGAALNDNVFKWEPGFDFVKKENGFDYVLDKFHLLSKSVTVKFIAESNENKAEKDVKITVKDANRPFILEPLDTITVNEGEEVKIEPKYNDPDNDKVIFSYSGWMTRDTYKTNFNDAGTYVVKVTGSDGFYVASQFLTINVKNVNRKPVFEPIKELEVTENETIEVELKAYDTDNDIISFSAENLPSGAKIEKNIFVFKPDFDFVKAKEKEKIEIKFIASDDESEAEQTATITIVNKNRAPQIINYSKDSTVNVDEPITLFVSAEDPDGDALSYLWDFGLFDRYNATAAHKRLFTSKGTKEVKVTVSDGVDEATRTWLIDVI